MIYQTKNDICSSEAQTIATRLNGIFPKGCAIAIEIEDNTKCIVCVEKFFIEGFGNKCNVKLLGSGINRFGEVCIDKKFGVETHNLRAATKDEVYALMLHKIVPSIVPNGKYTWVAFSNDGSFEDSADEPFDTIEKAYYNMRDAVLRKMTWNTEFTDFGIGASSGEEMSKAVGTREENDMAIGYDVLFFPSAIIHKSYSGDYYYDIMPCYTFNEKKKADEYEIRIDITIRKK